MSVSLQMESQMHEAMDLNRRFAVASPSTGSERSLSLGQLRLCWILRLGSTESFD